MIGLGRSLKTSIFFVVVACAALTVAGLGLAGRFNDRIFPQTSASRSDNLAARPVAGKITPQVQHQIEVFCGDCHAFPSPDSAPREAWPKLVRDGFDKYFKSGRHDLALPDDNQVIAYYTRRAPRDQDIAPPPVAKDRGPVPFKTSEVHVSAALIDPSVAHIHWFAENSTGQLLFCDMRSGLVAAAQRSLEETNALPLARLANPCHLESVDFDADGKLDLLVADLGAFTPADHDMGRVVWLRQVEPGQYEPIELATRLGRVADVQAADFNSDGLLDLVVAEFGWHDTGRVLLLENGGFHGGKPSLTTRVLDPRHGAIHVPVVDLNGDGRLDVVCLISQEHEVIEAFLARPDGSFETKTIHAAANPSYASSGIQMKDLDGDGDLDVLYTNGDAFDSQYLKPYHAVQWLENKGSFPFTHRILTGMPGVHRALAGDVDLDGDLDIVAVSMLPGHVPLIHGAKAFDSLLWLEQTQPGQYERHALENGLCEHAALELGDFDFDGDLDLAVGNAHIDSTGGTQMPPALVIWWNQAVERRQ